MYRPNTFILRVFLTSLVLEISAKARCGTFLYPLLSGMLLFSAPGTAVIKFYYEEKGSGDTGLGLPTALDLGKRVRDLLKCWEQNTQLFYLGEQVRRAVEIQASL